MPLLIIFAFIGGFVTILSPCILPLLPIILAGGVSQDEKRPLGIIVGFVGSFTFFTLALSAIVRATGLSADALRNLAVFFLLAFGLMLVVPKLKHYWELFTSRFSPQGGNIRHGFGGGILIGLSLGLVWTPCVGPILASVITLAASSTVTATTALITLSYALGTAVPLFAIMQGSSFFMSRFTWLKNNSGKIQQVFGLLMVATALLIYLQLDRSFQAYILNKFPSYGTGLTSIEDTEEVKQNLDTLKEKGGNMGSTLKSYGLAPEITGGGNWINSPPLTLEGLRGKVVLVDFWTYSCINCIRTLPYLRAWHDKYSQDGLVIVGVHSPEFEFEKDYDNVVKAVADFDLKYPIVQDNDFKIWRAYNNHYWPAKYLIDKEGKIRMTHFGEGAYDETEIAIQELLGESSSLVDVPAYSIDTRSPETYLGYWRIDNFVSTPRLVKDKLTLYSSPDKFSTNGVGFVGSWNIHEKQASSSKNSSLRFHFDAKAVHLVMSPSEGLGGGEAVILLDGKEVQRIKVEEYKLYTLIELTGQENHYVEIQFPDGNIDVYAFTFG